MINISSQNGNAGLLLTMKALRYITWLIRSLCEQLRWQVQIIPFQEVEHLQELVECGAKKYIRLDEATKLYSIGLTTARKMAKESGAIYKIGGTVLIKVAIFEDYIENKGKESKKGKR